LCRGVETRHVVTGGADAEREGFPPLLEARVLNTDSESAMPDLSEPGLLKQLRKMAFTCSGQSCLTFGPGIALPDRLPEQAEWTTAAFVVPDTRRHDTMPACHTAHFPKACDGVRHEMDDELCERGIECVILEREPLRGRSSHRDSGVAFLSRRYEGLRRIDRRDRRWSQSPHQFRGQRTRAATDIEHSLPGSNCREIGEEGSERYRIPAHESVVGTGPNGKAHESFTVDSSPLARSRIARSAVR
jgi:hypothetical protein